MGCDIHLAAEVRQGRKWTRVFPRRSLVDDWMQESADEAKAKQKRGEPLNGMDRYYLTAEKTEWYSGRNYNLFSVLADVRNGVRGNPFLLTEPATGHYIAPIDSPRGLPKNMSLELRRAINEKDHDSDAHFYIGDHSFSYLTLRELQEYDWDAGAVTTGIVSLEQFLERIKAYGDTIPLRADDSPYNSWCGGIGGYSIKVYDAVAVREQLRGMGVFIPSDPTITNPHVTDSWITPTKSQVGSFYDKTMPALAELGAPDDVRIVFGFDS